MAHFNHREQYSELISREQNCLGNTEMELLTQIWHNLRFKKLQRNSEETCHDHHQIIYY